MIYCCYCFLWFSLNLFNNEEYTLPLVRSMRYLQVVGGKDENFERKINLLCSKHRAVLVKCIQLSQHFYVQDCMSLDASHFE